MQFRNPHIQPATAPRSRVSSLEREEGDAGRMRLVTNSPAMEYAARAGQVERLPDAMAALILCKTGRSKVERHQITVEIEGAKTYFSCENSVTIAALNGTDERALWAYNKLRPDLLHILTDDGAYVESIPRKGEGRWFANDEESQAAFRTAKGHIARDMDRLQHLHQVDSDEAARVAQQNAAEVARVVHTFSQPAEDLGTAAMPRAERFAAAEALAEEKRTSSRNAERERAQWEREAGRVATRLGAGMMREFLEENALATERGEAMPAARLEADFPHVVSEPARAARGLDYSEIL